MKRLGDEVSPQQIADLISASGSAETGGVASNTAEGLKQLFWILVGIAIQDLMDEPWPVKKLKEWEKQQAEKEKGKGKPPT